MFVPVNWLKEFISVKETAEELEQILTLQGLEVEGINKGLTGDVIEIELTPNRGDCASILGVARELSAFSGNKYSFPDNKYTESGASIDDVCRLEVANSEKCPSYYLKLIRNIKVAESPEWIKNRLEDCGVRPLNNVVDITNYVMLETGQPLHAFDMAKLEGNKVAVRDAKDGEELLFLDGVKRELTSDDLVIADSQNPIALAGVMGGEESSVTEATTDILLESAFFQPAAVSRTERRHSLKTEASYRFTRHVDENGVKKAMERAVKLLEEFAGGSPAPGELVHEKQYQERIIKLNPERINKLLGTELEISDIEKSLDRLEFKVNSSGGILCVTVPSWRNDVTRAIDVIEEVARIYGYEKIKPALPESKVVTDLLKKEDFINSAEEVLRALEYKNCVTYSMVSSSAAEKIQGESINAVQIRNPVNKNLNIMRTNCLYGLLEVAAYNINQNQKNIKFYERGNIYFRENSRYKEREQIAFIAQTGNFYEIKAAAESVLRKLKQNYIIDYSKESDFFDNELRGSIIIDGNPAGEFGVVTKEFLKEYRVARIPFAGGYLYTDCIDVSHLENVKFSPWSPFPSIKRDISLVVPVKLTHFQIYDKILNEGGNLLKKTELFDIFEDKNLGNNVKCMTYTLEFNSSEKTLTSEEVDRKIENIVKVLNNEFEIKLRPD